MTPLQLPIMFLFRARFGDSRLKEVESLAGLWRDMSRFSWSWNTQVLAYHGGDIGPDLLQSAPLLTDCDPQYLANIAQKSIACRGVFFVLGEGKTLLDCVAQVGRISSSLYDRIDGFSGQFE